MYCFSDPAATVCQYAFIQSLATSTNFPQAQTFEGQEPSEVAAPVYSLTAPVHGIVYPINFSSCHQMKDFFLHNDGQGARCIMCYTIMYNVYIGRNCGSRVHQISKICAIGAWIDSWYWLCTFWCSAHVWGLQDFATLFFCYKTPTLKFDRWC